MPELRRDPIVGRWVVMGSDRLKGPKDFPQEDNTPTRSAVCPFCPGREAQTPPETDAVRPVGSMPNGPGWLVRTVPNKFPALSVDISIQREALGIYDLMSGSGAHEVVIEHPDHTKALADLNKEEVEAVLSQYQHRYLALAQCKDFKYVLIFKNFGSSAGATIEHGHSQVIALPMVPKSVLGEIKGAEHYHQSQGRCVFCDMIEQEYHDKERIVAENSAFIAFCPFTPRYAFETWIIPKAHSADFAGTTPDDLASLAALLHDVLNRLKKIFNNPSYNFYLHTAPINYASPSCYHWHIEIIPKLTRSVGFEWGTGLHIVPTLPQDAAKFLREASY